MHHEEFKIKEQSFDYNGINISYEFYNDTHQTKPTLVMIHGFLSSKFCYQKMYPFLFDYFNIVTLDYPPFGNSDKKKDFTYTYKNFAEIVVALIDYLQIPSVYLAGHSMGGQISLICAYYYPEKIKKLILFSPSSYMKKADSFTRTVSYLPFFKYFLKRFLYKKGVYETLCECVYDVNHISEAMLKAYMQPFLNNDIYHCLTKMIRDREGDLTESFLQQIKTDCVIFWGKEDVILPISIGYQLVNDLPSAKLITYMKIGHLLPEEIPDELSLRIKEFCM